MNEPVSMCLCFMRILTQVAEEVFNNHMHEITLSINNSSPAIPLIAQWPQERCSLRMSLSIWASPHQINLSSVDDHFQRDWPAT